MTDTPVLQKLFSVTIKSVPAGASVDIDDTYVGVGGAKVFKGNLIERMMDKLKEDRVKRISRFVGKGGFKK